MSTGYEALFAPAMRVALAEAAGAAAGAGADPAGADVPVGAVILDAGGAVVARARNRREAGHDPTAHAEMLAIRAAARRAGQWRLTGCTLVVTLEPCTMCAGAVTAARLDRLVYGAEDPKAGRGGLALGRRPGPPPRAPARSDRRGARRRMHRTAPPVLPRAQAGRPRMVSSPAVESPSGRGRTPRKRVRGQPLRGFKSHLHRQQDDGGHGCATVSTLRADPFLAMCAFAVEPAR